MKKIFLALLLTLSVVASFAQSTFVREGVTSGTNTYAATVTSFTGYTNSVVFLRFTNANTAASTVNINGLGTVNIRLWDGDSWEPLASGDIDANDDVLLVYDNTNTYYKAYVLDGIGQGTGGGADKQDLRPDHVYVSGTTYTPTDADAGKIIHLTNATSTTVTLATGIDAKTVLTFVRDTGAGLVTFVDDGTSSLLAPNGETLDTELAWATWIKDETLDNFYGVGALGPAAGGAVDDVFGRTGSVVAVAGDYTATQITNTPAGTIAATNVQTAINELDTEKQAAITFGTGVLTALGINVGSAGAPVLYNGAGGTPSAITLTNGTGLPVSTGISGLGTGVATWLATPSSANLASALTDEVGTGSVVMSEPDVNTQTGSYTLVLSDKAKEVRMNVAGANDITVPPNSSVAFPVGSMITLTQYGAGQTSVIAGSGVTIRTSAGNLLSPGQYSPMVLRKIATDEWYLWNGQSSSSAAFSVTDGIIDLTATGSPGNAVLNAMGISATINGISSVASGDMIYGSAANTFTNRNVFNTTPLFGVHLKAGTTALAPFGFTSGTNLTTPVAGGMEYDGSVLYFSPSTTRYRVMIGLTGSVTADVGSIAAQTTSSPSTITVTGAAVGDPCYVGASAITAGTIFTAQVTATNTVTVYITNPTSGALDPPNATYSVRVIKTP